MLCYYMAEKIILPSQEIHFARSCKHCTNNILKETKTCYMPYNDDENHSPSYYPEQTNDLNKYG